MDCRFTWNKFRVLREFHQIFEKSTLYFSTLLHFLVLFPTPAKTLPPKNHKKTLQNKTTFCSLVVSQKILWWLRSNLEITLALNISVKNNSRELHKITNKRSTSKHLFTKVRRNTFQKFLKDSATVIILGL